MRLTASKAYFNRLERLITFTWPISPIWNIFYVLYTAHTSLQGNTDFEKNQHSYSHNILVYSSNMNPYRAFSIIRVYEKKMKSHV